MLSNSHKKVHIFAMAAQGRGLSGGDRIFIEFARRWRKLAGITIYVNEEGRKMCRKQKLYEGRNLTFVIWDRNKWRKKSFILIYFGRILKSIFEAFNLDIGYQQSTILYSASEFWMDSLPAFILKLRYPRVTWAASWYQTAPNPFMGYTEGRREKTYNFKAFLYWLAQLPIKPIVVNFADYVLLNNQTEKKQFPTLNKKKRAVVILGAIDLDKVKSWKLKVGKLPKIYDAVFQGRFHPQKGVVELIDIWKKVTDKIPNAKLAMIGDGPLMKNVKFQITNSKLQKNVKLFGYLFDGLEKYKIFAQSKIVVHPAFYDSGGMAAAEAMAFGLPCVGFNLKSYKSYYPKGMVKVEVGNLTVFAKKIIELLENLNYRERISKESLKMIESGWSWEKRAKDVFTKINKINDIHKRIQEKS